MAGRKSTGKRARFEVFKRDGFRCAYCGRSPPDVVLHVDHIIAVAKGGKSEPSNLISACVDCNQGKAAVPLTSVVPLMERQAEEALERAEQVRAYAEAVLEARAATDATVAIIEEAWFRPFPPADEDCTWVMSASRRSTIRQFLGLLSVAQLLEAIDITQRAIARRRLEPVKIVCQKDRNGLNDSDAFRYFCGVCWRTIKDKNGAGA